MATLATSIGRGTLAARPATMPAGSLYYVTDTSTLYRSNGTTWDSIEAAAVSAYTDEQARDAIGAALVAGSGITVTPNDPGDTITIAATGSVVGTHTHIGSDVTDFSEVADDRIASLLVAGSGITLTYNDAANTLTIAASGSGVPPAPTWLTGRYYGAMEVGKNQSPGNTPMTANRLYLTALRVPATRTVDRLSIYVGTLVASTNIRLGIYGDFNAAGTASLLLDAGTIDSSSTGTKELTISQSLSAGWYWLACISNGAPAVPTFSGYWGPNLNGQANPSTSTNDPGWVKDGTGGYTALPSTFTVSGATSFTSMPLPMVRAG